MNKKWTIGILVVVVLGVLAYLGTNTDLFKGALRGGEKGGEKGDLPAVTQTRCDELQKWYDQGILSDKIKNALPYQLACMKKYSKLFSGWINQDSCKLISNSYKRQGLPLPPPPPSTMGPEYPKGLAEYMCLLRYPNLWTDGELSPDK